MDAKLYMDGTDNNDTSIVRNDTLQNEEGILELINNEAASNLIPIFITCGILMLVGIIGNSLVVQVYWCRMKSSAKRTFILALALLDLTVCVIVIPFELYDLRNQTMFTQDGLCKAMRFLEYSTVLSGGFVLVSISFERYYFLCRAFREFSPRKAKLICALCSVCAMIVACPSAFFAGSKIRHEQYGKLNITGYECSMNSEQTDNGAFKRFYYYFLAAIFFGCFLVFIVLYSIIGRLLWKYHTGKLIPDMGLFPTPALSTLGKKASVENSSGQSQGSNGSEQERNVSIHGKRSIKSAGSIVIFFSVTVVFVLSFLPHIIIRLMLFFNFSLEDRFDRETSELLYNFIVRSYLISNVANPFIYSILNTSFRKELKRTIGCFRFRKARNRTVLIPSTNRRFYV